MRRKITILITGAAIFVGNQLLNVNTPMVETKQVSEPVISTTVGDRIVMLDTNGRVSWQHDGQSEHILTLDRNLLSANNFSARLLRTSGAAELTAPLDTYRSLHALGERPTNRAQRDEVIVEYSINSFHGKLAVSISGDGSVRVIGKSWDGKIDKLIGQLSEDHTAAIDFYARQFAAKPLFEIEPARSLASRAEGSTTQVMTFPGSENAVQIYLEQQDGSIWHGGFASEERGRYLLIDLTRKLLELEDYAPNRHQAVTGL